VLRITEELRHGEEYWALERKLCHALINEDEVYIIHVPFSFSLENVYIEWNPSQSSLFKI
jgi:hypothetical protein